MAIACIGECNLGAGSCPKHMPPALNPNPCWLLDLVFSAPRGPDSDKWERVRVSVRQEPDALEVFRPRSVEVKGREGDALDGNQLMDWAADTVHGALLVPCGTRLLTEILTPIRLMLAASTVKRAVDDEERVYGRFYCEGPSSYSEALDRIIEIAHCTTQQLGEPRKLVVVYGW